VLSNAMLLTEGYDDPGIDCVVVLRPTRSRSLYCLDEETEILTSSGWKKSIAIGESVAAFDPETESITYSPCIATVRRPLGVSERWCSIASQSVDIRVTNNHRMLYDHKKKTGWKFKTAESLASLRDTSYIPCAGYMRFKGVPLSDDELRFIGWVMTDGSINKVNGAIIITQGEHQPWLEKIQQCIDGCGFKNTRKTRKRVSQFKSNSDAVTWTISRGKPRGKDKHKTGWGKLAPFLSKDFSPLLMSCSGHQFDVLLEAIHYGDGAKQFGQTWKRGSYHISTGNKTFADRLQIAAILHGWRTSISVWHQNQNPVYVIHLKQQNWVRVGGSGRDRPAWQVEQPKQNDVCWCVQNEVGTIITRRNGKVAILGNCQMTGRGTRVSPFKEDLLLLDLLWLHQKHNLIRPAHLVAKSDEEAELITKIAREKQSGGGDQMALELEGLATEAAGQRHEALRKQLDQARKKKGKLIDAMEWCLQMGQPDLADYEPTMKWESASMTDKQAKLLKRAGVDIATVTGKGHASKLIDVYMRSQKLTLASEGQRRVMRRLGHPNADAATADEARRFFANLKNKAA
jgi:hypothetical protein